MYIYVQISVLLIADKKKSSEWSLQRRGAPSSLVAQHPRSVESNAGSQTPKPISFPVISLVSYIVCISFISLCLYIIYIYMYIHIHMYMLSFYINIYYFFQRFPLDSRKTIVHKADWKTFATYFYDNKLQRSSATQRLWRLWSKMMKRKN